MPRDRSSKLIIPGLAVLLVGSNAWWLYHSMDLGVTIAYRDQVLYEAANTNVALSKLSSHLLAGRTKQEATVLLRTVFPSEQPYEKEGAIHVTWLTLELNSDGAVSRIQSQIEQESAVRASGAASAKTGR
jgi:hypothetical protein